MSVTKARYLFVSIVVLLLVGAGCGDQGAIDRAKAQKLALESQAAIEATRVAQAHALEMERMEAERKAAEWEVNHKTNVLRKDMLLFALSVLLIVGIGALGLLLLFRMRLASKYATEAFGIYTLQKADLMSRLIRLDESTRTWPALLTGEAVHQLETGGVLLLDEPSEPNAQALWGSTIIRALGLAERGAKRVGVTRGDPAALETLGATVTSVRGLQHDASKRPSLGSLPFPTLLMCQECDSETNDTKATITPDGSLTMACPECRAKLLQ